MPTRTCADSLYLRLDCSADAAHHVLKMLPQDRTYEVILDRVYSASQWPSLVEATVDLALIAPCHKVSLGAFGSPPTGKTINSQATYDAISRANAIDIHMAWLLSQHRPSQEPCPSPHHSPRMQDPAAWDELRLLVRRADGTTRQSLHDLDASIPWGNLRRLSIIWEYPVPMNQFIHDISINLTRLEALRLRADHRRLYHPLCKYEVPISGLFADAPHVPEFGINFTHMKHLRELEIDGMCNHVPISGLLGPDLRSFRLHREDAWWSVYSTESQRTPADVALAAKLAPNLERLELDIGYIDNLWHPTAIPGVDVDVEQYSFLDAISKFRKLRFLRLFPPCVPKNTPRFSPRVPHCLPVTDDQAIRLFEHLRRKCPSLQMLSIAAVPSFVDIDTMCWEVRRKGEKTVLTTKHRERNYQHRQVWVGQRRLTSEIKRFTTPQKYLTDSDSWVLTRNDVHDIR